MKKIFVLTTILALFTIAATAQRGPAVQHHRIQKGFENGQLTRGEKFRLQKNNTHYRHTRRKALRDGRLTTMEKRRLYSMKRQNNHKTFRLKHNPHRRVF